MVASEIDEQKKLASTKVNFESTSKVQNQQQQTKKNTNSNYRSVSVAWMFSLFDCCNTATSAAQHTHTRTHTHTHGRGIVVVVVVGMVGRLPHLSSVSPAVKGEGLLEGVGPNNDNVSEINVRPAPPKESIHLQDLFSHNTSII
jgi:hypothetical protein